MSYSDACQYDYHDYDEFMEENPKITEEKMDEFYCEVIDVYCKGVKEGCWTMKQHAMGRLT